MMVMIIMMVMVVKVVKVVKVKEDLLDTGISHIELPNRVLLVGVAEVDEHLAK